MDRIGQASEKLHIPASTLRGYDREGLFPVLTRLNGVRQFSDEGLEALNLIGCLKLAGPEIRDVRRFMERCSRGAPPADSTPPSSRSRRPSWKGRLSGCSRSWTG